MNIASNRPAGTKWFDIKNATEESADMYLYDVIGDPWVGTDASTVVRQISELKTKSINLHINSPGGYVFEGFAIYNALKNHDAKVTTYIDGYAASIASVIALAGERVVIAENAFFMIHNPWSLAIGESKDLRKEADVLDQLKESIITTYATKTGKDRDEVSKLMDAETWFNSEDSVSNGFADEINKGVRAMACASVGQFEYKHAPDPKNQESEEGESITIPVKITVQLQGQEDGGKTLSAQTPDTGAASIALRLRRQALLEKTINI